MVEYVVLVDENNIEIGVEEKLKAHQDAKLHRAFSIFVFNSKGELLLQQRAKEKYHCSSLWTNTVCSHPKPNESLEKAVHRRLIEEMGFDCDLKGLFSFIYKAEFNNGLTEYEYDFVFVGRYDNEKIVPNSDEVMNYKWITLDNLKKDVEKNPEKYTPWIKIILEKSDLLKY